MIDRVTRFEQEILASASDFAYPPTPQIAQAVMLRIKPQVRVRRLVVRRVVLALVIIAVFLAGLMQVPPVRAALLEWIQIGVVRIFRPMPNPVTATPAPGLQAPTGGPAGFSLLNLAGETTLAEAQARLNFPILVPSHPNGLGLPDRVFLQEQDGPMLVLVWLHPADPGWVRLSLHTLTPGSWAIDKAGPKVIQETSVNGQHAVWTVGPYFLMLRNKDFDLDRMIDGHVLIWTQDGMTYRLETDLPLEEAILIAESLAPTPPVRP